MRPDPAEMIAGHPRLSPMGRFLVACQRGPRCGVELYVDQVEADHVLRFSVRKLDKATYAAVLLTQRGKKAEPVVSGVDGSREDVQCWLVSEGVPVLRISPPKGS